MTDPESTRAGRARALLWMTATALLAGLALAAGYALRPLISPDAALSAPVNTSCDLSAGPCASGLPGRGRIILSVEPRGIPVLQPLEISVRVEGLQAQDASVDFVGVNMDMGLNRAPLEPDGQGRFTGRGMLPVCARSRMVWDARVLVQTPEGLASAPFRFETHRP